MSSNLIFVNYRFKFVYHFFSSSNLNLWGKRIGGWIRKLSNAGYCFSLKHISLSCCNGISESPPRIYTQLMCRQHKFNLLYIDLLSQQGDILLSRNFIDVPIEGNGMQEFEDICNIINSSIMCLSFYFGLSK